MGKVAAKKQQKTDALFNAAFDLFTSDADANISISDIAKAAGVAKGTFYLYFRDKVDLKNRLIRKKTAAIFKNAADALIESDIEVFEDRVIFVVDHIIDQLASDKNLVRLIGKSLSWGIFRSAVEAAEEESDLSYEEMYEHLIESIGSSDEDPTLLIYMIMELVSGSTYTSILYDDPVPIETLKPTLYTAIRQMVRGR